MIRSLLSLGLVLAFSLAVPAAFARDGAPVSAGDAGSCPADLAAAKADAEKKPEPAPARAAGKPATVAPVRAQGGLRGNDATPPGARLGAPRWHSFLPGMFR